MNPFVTRCHPGLRLGLLGIAWSVLAALILYRTLLAPSYFQDDRYNLGVVRRSALPTAHHLLETSLVHFFFQPYALPRAEDWHNGLSILLLAGWTRVIGPSHEWALRIPHLLWVALWLLLAVGLLRALRASTATVGNRDKYGHGWTLGWPALAVVAALTLAPWAHPVMSDAFLDDVPAADAALALVLLFIYRPSIGVKTAAGAGALAGLAFVMKDFYLLWAPIGLALLLALRLRSESVWPRPWLRPLLVCGGVFVMAYSAVVLPKMAWRWQELGGPLESPARYAILCALFDTTRVDANHFPFFLYGDESYRSPVALAGGIRPALAALGRSLRETDRALLGLSPAWLWLIPVALWLRLTTHVSRRYQVLYTAFGVSLAVYGAFYIFGLAGDGTQLRYWLVPVTLSAVCGIYATAELLARGRSPNTTWGRVDLLWLAPLAFVILVSYVRPTQFRDALARGTPPLQAAAASQLAAHLAPADAALLGNPEGIYFWSEHPAARVVALTVEQLVRLEAPRLRQLVDTYGIRVALLPAGLPLQQLEAIGFQVIQRGDNWVLLARESGLDQSS